MADEDKTTGPDDMNSPVNFTPDDDLTEDVDRGQSGEGKKRSYQKGSEKNRNSKRHGR